MKKLLFIVTLMTAFNLRSQENAFDYMVPPMSSYRSFNLTTSTYMPEDLADLKAGFSNEYRSYEPDFTEDGRKGIKVIHYTPGLFSTQSHAYFLSFSGNNVQLYGYSEYMVDDDGLFYDTYNENYQAIAPANFSKVPNESYQTTDQTYYDPQYKTNVTVTAMYKTMKVAGYEKKLLVLEYNKNGSTMREYYMKNFGLVAFQTYKGEICCANLSPFILFPKSDLDANTNDKNKEKAWTLFKSANKIQITDSFFTYGNSASKLFFGQLDSLSSLYQHLLLRSPEMNNAYRYMLSVKVYDLISKVYDGAKKYGSTHDASVQDYVSDYLMMRPYIDYLSKEGLSAQITNVENDFYKLYWKTIIMKLSSVTSNSSYENSYKAYLMKSMVNTTIKYDNLLDNVNKCILSSYIAVYYNFTNEPVKRYQYITKSVENYQYLSTQEKDINIDYMRSAMKNLSSIVPGNEEDLLRAMNAVLGLKDYNNAVKIGENGLSNSIGKSPAFAIKFAEAAYNDDLNKESLRKALKLLQGRTSELSYVQLQDYVKYCQAMGSEFNCSDAESQLKKAKKKEQNEAEKKQKESKRSNRSGGSSRNVNLALMANPFAGLDIEKTGFKFLPMSANLRIRSTELEFRYNPFMGADFKNRFVGGKLSDNSGSTTGKWINLKGADYGLGIYFKKIEGSSYRKEASAIGGGLQLIYGNFNSADETAEARIDNIYRQIILRPKITRYEGLLNFSYTLFNWKTHLAATMFYGAGLGVRSIEYGNYTYSQEVLSDSERTAFTDKRFVQSNWTGFYFTFRMGFRFGFTIF